MAEIPDEVRNRLALVLDVDDLVEATRLARELQPWFGVVKVGLELFSAAGPDAVVALADLDFKVFVDLKLCDIPTTVGRAARVLGGLGASYLTMHAFGGPVMLRAGADGLAEGAAGADLPPPTALAVTILTSDDGAPPHVLGSRVRNAMEGRCGGIVCAAADVGEAKRLGPRLIAAVPGIRLPGADADDQARAATPEVAVANGADLLVIGRTVTRADDRAAAAAAVAAAITVPA
ncbi:MAG: orotidine-5'-phosphate decarboxylase [Acidimicrobiales bacterium]